MCTRLARTHLEAGCGEWACNPIRQVEAASTFRSWTYVTDRIAEIGRICVTFFSFSLFISSGGFRPRHRRDSIKELSGAILEEGQGITT